MSLPNAHDIISADARQLEARRSGSLPVLIVEAGDRARWRFIEFFTAEIRNRHTRRAYARAVRDFCAWCSDRSIPLENIRPTIVAGYIEDLGRRASKPTVKQSLAAIRMLMDYFVLGHAIESNPASSVRGPKYVIKKGKTPVLSAEETRQLLDSIDIGTIGGLRDRALIGVMVFSFARVGAVVGMNVEDYYPNGKRWWLRLSEKGGKHHEVPAHHNAEAYVDAYLSAAGIGGNKGTPLFRTLDRHRQLTERRVYPNDVLRMLKRRAVAAGIVSPVCCHTFRATGITEFLRAGGTLERAAAIAAHESTRTTQLYNRTADEISLDEIERIVI